MMKRILCLWLAALMIFGAGWTTLLEARASLALMADGETSGSGDSVTSGGSAGSGDSVTSGGSAGSGDSVTSGGSAGSGDSVTSGGSVGSGDSVSSGGSVGSGDNLPIQLTAPTRLGWGRDYRFLLELYRKQKPEKVLTDELGEEYVDCPGMMYWRADGENQRQYQIDLYYQDPEAGPTLIETVKEWKTTANGSMDSNFRFFWNVRASGEYYFTVRAVGDGVTCVSSAISKSNAWVYEAPEAQLTRPSRPRWKNVTEASTAFIYPPTDEDNSLGSVDSLYRVGYQARWWYSATLTKETKEEVIDDSNGTSAVVTEEDDGDTEEDPTKPVEAGAVLTFYPKHYEFKPSEKMIGEYGSGYYSVQVRALSGNITKARPSEWSELSMVRYVAGADEDLQAIVDRVDKNTDNMNRQLAINNVRRFGTYKLTELMAADVNNTGAVAAIQQLENITGNYAQIVVSGGLDDLFPEQNVSVIGAGLNVDLGETVVFHLGAAHADEVPSTLYSHAVRFSMQLLGENGASLTPNGTELKVPAKITLPVPEDINPTFFTILHHRMDGTVETIPHVALRKVNDQWYASFIVTSFSDFTMAEAAVIAEAQAVTDGVSLDYRFKTEGVRTALCAVRDAAGRVRAVAELELTQTRKTLKIPCDGAPDSVKLFLLDANSAPVVAALTVPVT